MLRTPLLLILPVVLFLSACNNDDDDAGNSAGEEEEFVFAVDIGQSEIPYIVIDTDGEVINNEPKISATMDIYEGGTRVQSQGIGIEYRGSTSFRLSDKKSFGIESWDADGNDEDVSFFNFPVEEDWILNGHVVNLEDQYAFDRTLMYHHIGYEISRAIGKYASRTEFVELELNGEYLGVYVFMEKLKRDSERIDISSLNPEDNDASSITGGYILKIDKTSGGDLNLNQPLEYFENNWEDDARYTENISFRSQYDVFGELIQFPAFGTPYHSNQYLETYFLYEYPDASTITADQKNYIQNYIHEFESALLSDDFGTEDRTYTSFIDIESFVDYFLINEVCRNVDAFRLSTYLSKDRGAKLSMGPVWDMNIGFDSGDRVPIEGWVINYNQYVETDPWMMPFWWPRLLEDPQFREAIKLRWNEVRSGALSTSNLQRLVTETADYLLNNGAIERNYTKWSLAGINYEGSVESLSAYLETRTSWMDAEIGSF